MARPLSLAACLCSLSVLVACGQETDDTQVPDDTGSPTVYRDRDGDGVTADQDCDDYDPDRYPGAVDLCDGQDNDCDEEVDEDPDVTWYLDADGDGFGDVEAPGGASCEPIEGHVANYADCDDSDPAVFPGARETCDGVDQDCDGEVDEGASVYVETWGSDGGTGSSDDPYASLAGAIASGSACIAVGPGTYFENLTISNGPLWLYSTEGSAQTILDGDYAGAVVTVSSRATGDIVIEGFTLQNGYATYGAGLYVSTAAVTVRDLTLLDNYATSDGGGAYVLRGSLDAQGCVFEGNSANLGGGLYSDSGTIALSESTFSNNTAYYGGGLLTEGADVTISATAFNGNAGYYAGGGLLLSGGLATLDGVSVTDSEVTNGMGGGVLVSEADASFVDVAIEGNGAYSGGGGLLIEDSSVSLTSTSISSNVVAAGGGGGLYASTGSSLGVDELTITGNTTTSGEGGGGLFLYDGTWLSGTGLHITDNYAGNSAGGGFAAVYGSTMEVTDLELTGNRAYSFAGGRVDDSQVSLTQALIAFNEAYFVGGLGVHDGGQLNLTNCILLGNSADQGTSGSNHYGASLTAYNQGGLDLSYCTVAGSMGDYAIAVHSSTYFSMMSSILAFNAGVALDLPNSTYVYLSGAFNDFYGNELDNVYYNDMARGRIEGEGTLEVDPSFVTWDASALDAADVHLDDDSPCVDAGNSAEYDMDGSRADMGAYGGANGEW